MKRFTLALLVALSLISVQAFAQTAVSSVPQYPCTPLTATAAVNTVTTLTITPGAGQYVYLCGLDLNVSNDATGAVTQANVSFTSTNFGGWTYKYSTINAANTNGLDKTFSWNVPLKTAAPGTAVTIVSPAINLHAAYTITAYYYIPPSTTP